MLGMVFLGMICRSMNCKHLNFYNISLFIAAQLANIYSTEFVVETADGEAGKHYRQVFRNNMQEKVPRPSLRADVV